MRTFLVAVVGAAVFAAAAAQPTIDRPAECGVANRRSRLVGGEDTEVDEYPWQAAVVKKDSPTDFVVSGSLINDRFVLTNAYNMDVANVNAADILVILGAHKLSEQRARTQHAVDKIMPHAGYNYDDWWKSTDVELLRLASPVSTMPVCLPIAGRLYVDTAAIVAGWGSAEREGVLADQLEELAVTVWPNNACKQKIEVLGEQLTDDWESGVVLRDDLLCATGGDDKGICDDDGGNPLITLDDDHYTIIGISFAENCGKSFGNLSPSFDIYTRVTDMLPWIEEESKKVAI